MMNKTKKSGLGFTLIELLIVIAIIGILAGVVVISLTGGVGDARDNTVKFELSNLRSVAGLYYNRLDRFATGVPDTAKAADADGYEKFCGAIENVLDSIGATELDAGHNFARKATDPQDAGCNSSESGWVVWAELDATDEYYCIDASTTKEITGAALVADNVGAAADDADENDECDDLTTAP